LPAKSRLLLPAKRRSIGPQLQTGNVDMKTIGPAASPNRQLPMTNSQLRSGSFAGDAGYRLLKLVIRRMALPQALVIGDSPRLAIRNSVTKWRIAGCWRCRRGNCGVLSAARR
jgi:hypothetical protein